MTVKERLEYNKKLYTYGQEMLLDTFNTCYNNWLDIIHDILSKYTSDIFVLGVLNPIGFSFHKALRNKDSCFYVRLVRITKHDNSESSILPKISDDFVPTIGIHDNTDSVFEEVLQDNNEPNFIVNQIIHDIVNEISAYNKFHGMTYLHTYIDCFSSNSNDYITIESSLKDLEDYYKSKECKL